MPKLEAAIAGALALLLSSCGQDAASAGNGTASTGENAAPADNAAADPAQPIETANSQDEAVPPPDAVSHPNGYLPPAPAEGTTPLANSADSDKAPPATEDQYMRNGQ